MRGEHTQLSVRREHWSLRLYLRYNFRTFTVCRPRRVCRTRVVDCGPAPGRDSFGREGSRLERWAGRGAQEATAGDC